MTKEERKERKKRRYIYAGEEKLERKTIGQL